MGQTAQPWEPGPALIRVFTFSPAAGGGGPARMAVGRHGGDSAGDSARLREWRVPGIAGGLDWEHLARHAFKRLAAGLSSLAGTAVFRERVASLFRAAARGSARQSRIRDGCPSPELVDARGLCSGKHLRHARSQQRHCALPPTERDRPREPPGRSVLFGDESVSLPPRERTRGERRYSAGQRGPTPWSSTAVSQPLCSDRR
jgi:hypothetical protein